MTLYEATSDFPGVVAVQETYNKPYTFSGVFQCSNAN